MYELSWLQLSVSPPQQFSATNLSTYSLLLCTIKITSSSSSSVPNPPSHMPSPIQNTNFEETLEFDSTPNKLEIEQMEWYLREDCDGLIVPTREASEATCIEDLLPTEDDWCLWGLTESKDMASSNKLGAKSVKIPCSYSQPDFTLESGTERTDDIFQNSFLEADQLCPDSPYTSLSFEDLLSNMLAEPPNLDSVRGESRTRMDACGFPVFVDDSSKDRNTEDNSLSCLPTDKSKRFKVSPVASNLKVLVSPETSATNVMGAVAEPNCSEANALLELEDVMIKMNEKTRICFRDALYRLAKCSKQNNNVNQNRSTCATDGLLSAQVNCESSRMGSSRHKESSTNMIDRAIANLMFNEQYC